MSTERSVKLSGGGQPDPKFEGELRDFVRRNVTSLHRPMPESGGEASNFNSLIQRVAGSSVNEIEGLIAQLRDMRDYLEHEGERVQRAIADYARLSQTARAHLENLSDEIAQWKRGAPDERIERE